MMTSYYNEDLPIYGYIEKRSIKKRKMNDTIIICGITMIVSFMSGYLMSEYHCDKNLLIMDEI